jgi:hypothetical protein
MAVNAKVATVLDSISTSSDTVESEGHIHLKKKPKINIPPVNKCFPLAGAKFELPRFEL